jgi:Tol biopolymer transport system component
MGQYPGKPWCIFMVSADGGAPKQLTKGGDSTGFDPTWSPDGNSLAFGGNPFRELTASGKLVVHVFNLATHRVSVLPGSEGLWSPRWSPNSRYISAQSTDGGTLLVFDFGSQRWTELAKASFGYPSWSRDSEYIYFDTWGEDAAFFRVRIRDRKVERTLTLKYVARNVGTFGAWTGLAPDGSPLIQRDASLDEIYALDWEAP